ncbi:MAG: SdrD B-like domain-containing protein, partial [Pseudomonadota bacterium]
MTYQTYEFTAFTEADLLVGGDRSIGCGDSFTMPGDTTTNFVVYDNDPYMSGDYYRNDRADDWSGQRAAIEVDGNEVFSCAKVYVEKTWTLEGSDGQTYTLVEIEIPRSGAPGVGDDFFTFEGDVPPEGVELTVVSGHNDGQIPYADLGATPPEPPEPAPEDGTICVEAEDLHLTGYKVEHNDTASGEKLIKLSAYEGQATLGSFSGETGAYDLTLTYIDENDGQGELEVFVDGVLVATIQLDQDNNGNGVDGAGFSTFTIPGLEIPEGAEITLQGAKNCYEFVRIDKISFTPVEPEFRECDDPDAVKIDFEGFSAGAIVGDQLDGVTISGMANDDQDSATDNDAMVFDSASPTGGDTDLATDSQGKILIITEDDNDENPDDEAHGGKLTFTFDNPSKVFDIKVIDTEEGGVITATLSDGAVKTFAIPQIGDGAIAQVLIDLDDVVTLEVALNGSGGIDDLCYVPGEPEPGSLSGTYFMDSNGNGVDDGAALGDEDIAGKTVELFFANGDPAIDADGVPVEAVETDANGDYRFDNLAAGDYIVRFEDSTAENKSFIAANQGEDDTIDSDVIARDKGGGETQPVTVVAGQETKDVDAGVELIDPRTGEIGDIVWLDVFGDGVLNDEALDPNFSGAEQGVAGVTVQLKDAASGVVLDEIVTDADGKYLFTGLAAGTYVVGFVLPEGFEFTVQNAGDDDARDSDADPTMGMTGVIDLGVGESNLTVDAGLLRCGMIEGTSQNDQNSPVGGNDLLVGCATDDEIRGRSGRDTLLGNDGDDTVRGDSYDDVLFGGDGADSLRGDDDNDTLTGGAGDDTLRGGDDLDTAVFSGVRADYTITPIDNSDLEFTISGPDGTDLVRNVEILVFDDGEVLVESLFAGAVRDAVAAPGGPGGAVNIDVTVNDNAPSGGFIAVAAANDGAFGSVVVEPDGTVTYTAGPDFEGYDVFSYTIIDDQGRVDTNEVLVGALPVPDGSEPGAVVTGDGDVDVNGTNGDDLIIGGAGENQILGFGGNDTIDGSGGDDTILDGGNGLELVFGGSGEDVIIAGGSDDKLFGESGDDIISGQGGDDSIFGGEGDDALAGGAGDDFLSGGSGDDSFTELTDGADIAFGGAGDDSFVWSESNDAGDRDLIDGESGS